MNRFWYLKWSNRYKANRSWGDNVVVAAWYAWKGWSFPAFSPAEAREMDRLMGR